MSKSAVIIGATGLVGSAIVRELIKNNKYSELIILHRRTAGFENSKIKEHIIDFDDPASYENLLKGDVLFSSLGTTLKTAGSKEAQYKIDFQYQYNLARAAVDSGIKNYVLISSVGASSKSKTFYSKMKGELEDAVKKLNFEKIVILQPSILDGPRVEFRLMERIAITFTKLLSWIPGIRAYRPIHADIVAKASINSIGNVDKGIHTFQLEELFELADKSSNLSQ